VIVFYRPEGEPEQAFEFHPDRVRQKRAVAIEKAAGLTWDEWNHAVLMGSAAARAVLLWHLLSLTHAKLRLDDVDFAMGELTVEMSLAEMLEMREQVATSNRVKPEQRDEALQVLDADIEEARAREAAAQDLPQDAAEQAMVVAYREVAGPPAPQPYGASGPRPYAPPAGRPDPLPYDGGDPDVGGPGKAR
jgi:hypothetical protein